MLVFTIKKEKVVFGTFENERIYTMKVGLYQNRIHCYTF